MILVISAVAMCLIDAQYSMFDRAAEAWYLGIMDTYKADYLASTSQTKCPTSSCVSHFRQRLSRSCHLFNRCTICSTAAEVLCSCAVVQQLRGYCLQTDVPPRQTGRRLLHVCYCRPIAQIIRGFFYPELLSSSWPVCSFLSLYIFSVRFAIPELCSTLRLFLPIVN